MTKFKSTVTKLRLLGATALISIVALGVWQSNTLSTSAQSTGGFEGALVTVTPEQGKTFSLDGLAEGPFSVEGTIGDEGDRFYRTGILLESGAAVVQDVYVLQSFNGAIMAEGVLNPELKGIIEQANLTAVVGGVGTYRGATGEMQITTREDGSFTARLLEAKRRRGAN